MSECDIPFHIQEEIMKRLPVQSLIRFRSVSKPWKSLIDSFRFIAAHSLNCHTQPQHLLLWNEDSQEKEASYVSYLDDDTFPQQRSVLTLPPSVKELKHPVVAGSSRGLLCLYSSDPFTTKTAVIWNPSIRKSIVVDVPNCSSVGFGVCPATSDPKIIAITQFYDYPNIETNYSCKVMVYTLSSGKWRSLYTNLPSKPLQDFWCTVVTDRFIYWLGGLPGHNMIISFDVANETFEMIDLPDSLACHDRWYLYLFMVKGSLTMLECRGNIYTVWMMEHGVQKLFTKVFTIETSPGYIVGFRKNGIPLMQVVDGDPVDDDEPVKLVVYEPNLEHNNGPEICRSSDFFKVNSVMESLLLLGRSDCSSY